jgi:2-methylcitrate dehydratase PrpD
MTEPVCVALSALLRRPVAEADRLRAARHVLDWIGCAVAGANEPAGRILTQWRSEVPADRAFRWGGLGNILEMDDVDKRALLHPGPVNVPAVLAVGAAVGATGPELLDGLVRGYEATIRLGRAVGPSHYRLWHNTGTCGAIGAAAGAASLYGLDDDQQAQALALAVAQSTGLWQTRHEPQSMAKQLHTAHAARAGVDAAELAAKGFRGALTILEGPQGFFAATAPEAQAADMLRGPDAPWAVHDVSFKPWPACRHAHAAIDAALELRERGVPDGPITVETYAAAIDFCDKPEPRTVIEAKFSLQHAVAVTLLGGPPRLADFDQACREDPDVQALRRRIAVRVGEDLDANYPARFGARLIAGDKRIDVPDALGDPESPISARQLTDKAAMLMGAGGLSPEDVERLQGQALGLPEAGSGEVAELVEHLARWL